MALYILLALLVPIAIVGLIIWAIVFFVTKKAVDASVPEIPGKGVDALLYLGQFVTLTSVVGGLITIIFEVVNHRYKDLLELGYAYNQLAAGESVRLAVAMIIVALPLYFILAHFTSKRILEVKERAELAMRKVFLYAIIFVTTLTIAGSLVTLIYQLLSGELFVRFGPKAITLGLIAGFVLITHLYQLRRDFTIETKMPLYLGVGSAIIVVAIIVFGIAETGSPKKIRALRFDNERLTRLSNIQQNILQYWQRGGVLPATLADLNNDFGRSLILVDPETKKPFEYKVIKDSEVTTTENCFAYPAYSGTSASNCPKTIKAVSNATFEICAEFGEVRDDGTAASTGLDTGSVSAPSMPIYGGDFYGSYSNKLDSISYYYPGTSNNNDISWFHPKGKHCFKRTIDINQYSVYGR
jgi:hypothetical protein